MDLESRMDPDALAYSARTFRSACRFYLVIGTLWGIYLGWAATFVYHAVASRVSP